MDPYLPPALVRFNFNDGTGGFDNAAEHGLNASSPLARVLLLMPGTRSQFSIAVTRRNFRPQVTSMGGWRRRGVLCRVCDQGLHKLSKWRAMNLNAGGSRRTRSAAISRITGPSTRINKRAVNSQSTLTDPMGLSPCDMRTRRMRRPSISLTQMATDSLLLK